MRVTGERGTAGSTTARICVAKTADRRPPKLRSTHRIDGRIPCIDAGANEMRGANDSRLCRVKATGRPVCICKMGIPAGSIFFSIPRFLLRRWPSLTSAPLRSLLPRGLAANHVNQRQLDIGRFEWSTNHLRYSQSPSISALSGFLENLHEEYELSLGNSAGCQREHIMIGPVVDSFLAQDHVNPVSFQRLLGPASHALRHKPPVVDHPKSDQEPVSLPTDWIP